MNWAKSSSVVGVLSGNGILDFSTPLFLSMPNIGPGDFDSSLVNFSDTLFDEQRYPRFFIEHLRSWVQATRADVLGLWTRTPIEKNEDLTESGQRAMLRRRDGGVADFAAEGISADVRQMIMADSSFVDLQRSPDIVINNGGVFCYFQTRSFAYNSQQFTYLNTLRANKPWFSEQVSQSVINLITKDFAPIEIPDLPNRVPSCLIYQLPDLFNEVREKFLEQVSLGNYQNTTDEIIRFVLSSDNNFVKFAFVNTEMQNEELTHIAYGSQTNEILEGVIRGIRPRGNNIVELVLVSNDPRIHEGI